MQIAKCKMQNEKTNISERLLGFAADIVRLASQLNKTAVGRHIGLQSTRSATSAGANYEEACGAQSRADFTHKLQLVLKELKESHYWLRLIKKSDLLSSSDLDALIQEANELTKIVAKSVVTAKRNT